MRILNNQSLKRYNSLGINTIAKRFIEIETEDELGLIGNYIDDTTLILGGGSNILMARDYIDSVVHINIKGIRIIKEEEDYVLIEAGAGENWHELVMWSVERDFGGIENLALIPGRLGAAPMQNIGAYGVELKDVFHSLWAYNIKLKGDQVYHRNECNFGYRESIFKNELRSKLIITKVILRLSKKGYHKLNTSYGAINKNLESKSISKPDIIDIAKAVIEIRQSKLPDPAALGNAGSFFKNPVIPIKKFESVQQSYPEIPSYKTGDDQKIKVPAAWLIESCGFKGKRIGNTGTYENHALVIVNYGDATGTEIHSLANQIKASVLAKFGIELIPEVNLVS